MATPRHEIETIVDGLSDEARGQLIRLLGEVFNVLDNLDAICPIGKPPCHDLLRFDKLKRLGAALHERQREWLETASQPFWS